MPMNVSSLTDDKIIIALDAMGGDHAPGSILRGADIARKRFPGISFLLYGDSAKLNRMLNTIPELQKVCSVIHTDEVVASDDKPSVALRRSRNSSMALAIKAVRDSKAHAVVSAGNTGALMAIAKVLLRTLPGIDRPAIGGLLPSERGDIVMLDLGANVSCDANNLFEFAVMGDAFSRALLGVEKPSIGILNIGTEEVKGNEAVKTAASMLKESELQLNFYGHVEGNDLGKGTVDVVVTDGFSGNIALKTLEGTAKMMTTGLEEALKGSILGRIGGLIAWPSFRKFRRRFDPRLHNGAMLLGLNGIVIKSHGGMDKVGFANAIKVAVYMAKHRINQQIMEEMVESGHILPEDESNGRGI